MMKRANLSKTDIGHAFRAALQKGMMRGEDTAALFYDLDFLDTRLKYLSDCFPHGTLHGMAIKANPLAKILLSVKDVVPFMGVEAASFGEVNLGLRAGYVPERIVYDSPVKTKPEIEFALKSGIHLNIDNLDELERVKKMDPSAYNSTIGLRINPQVGLGRIAESSVAGNYSKFGVPVKYKRAEIENAFLSCPWLTGVHLHVGSQGCPLTLLVEGIGVLYDLICELNPGRIAAGIPPISIFDIGGGLPVSYHSETPAPSMEEYVTMIRQRAPGLFNPITNLHPIDHPAHPFTRSPQTSPHAPFRLITEFGRWIYTNPGWTVSRVEYVKHDPDINTAMLHVGADLLVRECLNPSDWKHEFTVFDENGRQKEGLDLLPWNLAGPLCFSGDIIAKEVKLPKIEEGDYVVIHDTGSYTFSMWSRYNSRQTPRIIGYRDTEFEILKERETVEELATFWI
jgi:diaminopimelate decarboxylase